MQMVLERSLGSPIFSLQPSLFQEQDEVACGLSPVCPQAALPEPRAGTSSPRPTPPSRRRFFVSGTQDLGSKQHRRLGRPDRTPRFASF